MPFLYVGFVFLFRDRIKTAVQHLTGEGLQEVLFLVFALLVTLLAIATVIRKLSLIPVLGVLFCAYLLVEIPAIAWNWFFIWMGIGLIIYFIYGYRKSRLHAGSSPLRPGNSPLAGQPGAPKS
jgi:APA family basic amino acid/polyamine antiporter